MIPLGRDSVKLFLWKRTETIDRGEVTEDWTLTNVSVQASVYPLSQTRTQAEEGQDVRDTYRVLFVLPDGISVTVGDRLGDADTQIWDLTDVKAAPGRASCVGVRL